MYVENKDGDIDGVSARIGYVRFSKSGRSVFYRGRELARANAVRGNHIDVATGDEYWVSGVKQVGDNRHRFGRAEYERLRLADARPDQSRG